MEYDELPDTLEKPFPMKSKVLTQPIALVILSPMELSNIQNKLVQNLLTDFAKLFVYDMIPILSRPLNSTERKSRDAAEWSLLLNVAGLIGVGILQSLPQPEPRVQLQKLARFPLATSPRRSH